MERRLNNQDGTQHIVIKNQNIKAIETSEELNYLYPNGHRITHQMRWYKGSRERGLRSDMAA